MIVGLPTSGVYTDRTDRVWVLIDHATWMLTGHARRPVVLDDAQMRLLIERDQHRGECRGLQSCNSHPVPNVISAHPWGQLGFEAYPARSGFDIGEVFNTLPEAMDAARALAVGE